MTPVRLTDFVVHIIILYHYSYIIEIHQVRPHKGQCLVASRLRALLHSDLNRSEIAESHRNCGKVQDAYTLRCVPQVHGIVHDTITFVKGILTTELNSATDNPLIFHEEVGWLAIGFIYCIF